MRIRDAGAGQGRENDPERKPPPWPAEALKSIFGEFGAWSELADSSTRAPIAVRQYHATHRDEMVMQPPTTERQMRSSSFSAAIGKPACFGTVLQLALVFAPDEFVGRSDIIDGQGKPSVIEVTYRRK